MHMANELLSVPVAAGTLALAGGCLGCICKKAAKGIGSQKAALMGVLGAFIFAAQMVNFQLPAMPGTSGHMVGAALLAIILGPHAAAVVISSVVIIQCLIFQDGGLLALGCNIINMAIVPSYIAWFLYRVVAGNSSSHLRIYVGTVLAALAAIEGGAFLVPIEAGLSGVLAVPFTTFLITMIGVHLLIGSIEGLITVAVLGYLHGVRPDIVSGLAPGKVRLGRKTVLATLGLFTVVSAGGLSLLASDKPDGLEWSYLERADQPGFESLVSNDNAVITTVDEFQSKYSPMPDYTLRGCSGGEEKVSAGWTSFAGVMGSVITMAAIWMSVRLFGGKYPLTGKP